MFYLWSQLYNEILHTGYLINIPKCTVLLQFDVVSSETIRTSGLNINCSITECIGDRLKDCLMALWSNMNMLTVKRWNIISVIILGIFSVCGNKDLHSDVFFYLVNCWAGTVNLEGDIMGLAIQGWSTKNIRPK